MAIDYSLFAIPKSRVKALDKADKAKAIEKHDKAENAKAKKRAGGRCEVRGIGIHDKTVYGTGVWRCQAKDTETHHLIGGIGRRNKGKSIMAEFKLRVCKECHAAITANVLRPTTAEHDASTVRYWRAR
jgi:uncharacterized cupin superfamily protein